jgi:hypothetical protein
MLAFPTPVPGLIVEHLDDDICLYRPDIDEVLVLNGSAGDIWSLADGHSSVEAITSRLAEAFGLATSDLRDDVQSVILDLETKGYLREGEQNSSGTGSE